MVQIITSGNLNIPALNVDDAYISIVNPPAISSAAPTDVIGVVGTASWGPVNIPQLIGSGTDAANTFGQISAAALTDPYDIATDLYIAFGQSSSQATLQGFGVRVTDGTDAAATGTLTGAASPAAKTVTVSGTITAADVATVTVTSTQVTGSPVSVAYTVKAGDTTATIATGLAAAINANAALLAAGVSATAAASVVSIYAPTAVTMTVTGSVSGAATEILTEGSGGTTTTGITLKGIYTGVVGNQIKVAVSDGSKSSTMTVTVSPPVGMPEVYPNLPSATFWTALQSAINNGIGTQRPRSQCVVASGATPAVGAPSTTTITLAGGTDGRAGVTTATLLGSDSATPMTGIWSLSSVKPAVGIAWMSGCTDLTAAPTLLSFAQSAGVSCLIAFPTGTTTAAAVTAWQAAGVADPSICPVKDFVDFFDQVNGLTRRVPPYAYIGGTWATLSPAASPGNKPVKMAAGTERNDPIVGNVPYTVAELGQLTTTGIMLITNPIPRGQVFGIRHGRSSSLDLATQPAEYWRMTMYLARSASEFIGQFVDELQSQQPQDPLRQSFALLSNQFLRSLQGAGQIDGFLVTCSYVANGAPGLGVNTQASVAAHYMFGLWQVTYLSSVWYVVLSMQGGTTVVEVSGQLQQQPVSL